MILNFLWYPLATGIKLNDNIMIHSLGRISGTHPRTENIDMMGIENRTGILLKINQVEKKRP